MIFQTGGTPAIRKFNFAVVTNNFGPVEFVGLFMRFSFFPVSAAAVSTDLFKIKACEQQTFTIIKEIIKTALMRDKIIVAVN